MSYILTNKKSIVSVSHSVVSNQLSTEGITSFFHVDQSRHGEALSRPIRRGNSMSEQICQRRKSQKLSDSTSGSASVGDFSNMPSPRKTPPIFSEITEEEKTVEEKTSEVKFEIFRDHHIIVLVNITLIFFLHFISNFMKKVAV